MILHILWIPSKCKFHYLTVYIFFCQPNYTRVYIISKFDLPASCRLQPCPLDFEYCLAGGKKYYIKTMYINHICERSCKVCTYSHSIYIYIEKAKFVFNHNTFIAIIIHLGHDPQLTWINTESFTAFSSTCSRPPCSTWPMDHWGHLCFLGGITLVVYNYSFYKYKLIYQAVWFPLKIYPFFSTEFSGFLILWLLTCVVSPRKTSRRKYAHYILPFVCNNFMPPIEIKGSCQKLCWSQKSNASLISQACSLKCPPSHICPTGSLRTPPK